jgi:hypothetical protein
MPTVTATRKRLKQYRCKMLVASPADGRWITSYLPRSVAWTAAQAIARETHYCVILCGEFGLARFSIDGGGHVEWNEKSTCPDSQTSFGPNTQVAI